MNLYPRGILYLTGNARQIAKAVAVIIVIVELGAIWNEIHHMRAEQVKNSLYALPEDRRNALRGTAASRRFESTANVDGDVKIDGEVQLSEPVQVEIDQ
jgi:hypothetical protein